jgi:MFS family permease
MNSIKNDGFLRLLTITSLVCGLEFCTASAFTYIPPILLKAGISESLMTWLMGCGPLLGFLLCPIIGHASDRCRSRYGKRRPFIVGFCLTIILCLILIPQSEAIGKNEKKKNIFLFYLNVVFFSTGEILQAPTIGLSLLLITCILFDFAAQACFNPCESLIYDTCKGTSQESSCFFVYSFMTSFGK